MNNLEDIVGKKLLNCSNKNTTLTEDGVFFRSKAEEIISLIEKTQASLQSDLDIKGNITLGCAETAYMKEIALITKEIKDLYPGIYLVLYSGNANDVLDRID